MVRRALPEPEPDLRIRLSAPAVPAYAAVLATATEVLLAGLTDQPDAIVAAVREVASAILGEGPASGRIEIQLTRAGQELTLHYPRSRGPQRTAGSAFRALADEVSSSGGGVTLIWRLPQP